MTRTTVLTATMWLAVAAVAATAAGGRGQTTAQRTKPTAVRRDPPPDADQRARMAKLAEARAPRLAKAAAAREAAIDRERGGLQQRRRADLEARNAKTRAEIRRLAAQAKTPAALAAARRVEIGREAAELVERSNSAPPNERDAIDRRAAELMEELKRLPR
jgi:hypothetical protein